MTIPFIRKLPNGKRVLQEIARDPDVENLAGAFIARGGRYLIEILPDAQVSLIAIIDLAGGCESVARETCSNAPSLPEAVDKLVRASIANTPGPSAVQAIAAPSTSQPCAR